MGTGPGFFLDAIEKYLPNNKDVFYGIEKYPPLDEYQTKSNNYILSDYDTLPFKVDGGICIEVIEHLTPTMFKNILKSLANVSNDGALYIFNTGMPEFVLNEDPGYLDPTKRGHIVSYSLKGVECIAKELGFTVLELTGKSWAFVLEYKSKSHKNENIQDRIWTALEDNLKILEDKHMGSVLKVLGLDTCRAYNTPILENRIRQLELELNKVIQTPNIQYKSSILNEGNSSNLGRLKMVLRNLLKGKKSKKY